MGVGGSRRLRSRPATWLPFARSASSFPRRPRPVACEPRAVAIAWRLQRRWRVRGIAARQGDLRAADSHLRGGGERSRNRAWPGERGARPCGRRGRGASRRRARARGAILPRSRGAAAGGARKNRRGVLHRHRSLRRRRPACRLPLRRREPGVQEADRPGRRGRQADARARAGPRGAVVPDLRKGRAHARAGAVRERGQGARPLVRRPCGASRRPRPAPGGDPLQGHHGAKKGRGSPPRQRATIPVAVRQHEHGLSSTAA